MQSVKKTLKPLICLLLLCVWGAVEAYQTFDVTDDSIVTAVISNTSFNKISVKNDRILHVIGEEGAYTLQTDNVLGQIYIRPLTDKPFTLNLTTEKGSSYQLSLKPVTKASETILLSPPFIGGAQAAKWESATPYEDLLVKLIQQMATGQFPDGYTVVAIKDRKPQPLGNVATVTKLCEYQGDKYKGEIYIITNLTSKPLTLTSQQLYRKGNLALALQSQVVLARGQTHLFVIEANEVQHG